MSWLSSRFSKIQGVNQFQACSQFWVTLTAKITVMAAAGHFLEGSLTPSSNLLTHQPKAVLPTDKINNSSISSPTLIPFLEDSPASRTPGIIPSNSSRLNNSNNQHLPRVNLLLINPNNNRNINKLHPMTRPDSSNLRM